MGPQPLYQALTLLDPVAFERVTRDEIKQWHQETIVQTGTTIAVTGAISLKDAGKAVDRILANLPVGLEKPAPNAQANFKPRTVLFHLPDAEKTTIGLIGQLPPTSEGDDLVDLLALQYFGQAGSGPLFDAVRTKLRASYRIEAGYTNFSREVRVMYLTGEVEAAKLANVRDVVLEVYEAYRTNPDLTNLDDLRRNLANGTRKNVGFVDTAARTILEFALDNRDPSVTPKLAEELEGIKATDVVERLAKSFPPADQLIVLAASPDATALPGACVITTIDQVTDCP